MKFSAPSATLLAAVMAAAATNTMVLADDIDIAWAIQPYEDETASPGDTITFTFAGHNVFIHPSGDCTEDGAITVGLTSPATYTFTEADVGSSLFFACDIGGHCESGQHITVNVVAAAVDGDDEGDGTADDGNDGGDGNNGGGGGGGVYGGSAGATISHSAFMMLGMLVTAGFAYLL